MDEFGIDTVDGVSITNDALTRRCVPSGTSKFARPRVVLHPLVGDSEERGGPSKGGENHDVKPRATPSKFTPDCLCSWEVRESSWRLNQRASSAAMITSCQRSQLSGEMPCTLMLSTYTEQTGSATVMRGASHCSRAKSRPMPVSTHHVHWRVWAWPQQPATLDPLGSTDM